jgi:hypothetical protein
MANEALSLAYLTPFEEQVFRQKQYLLKDIQSPRRDVVVRPLIQPTERSSPAETANKGNHRSTTQAACSRDDRGAGWRRLKRRHRDIFSTADTLAVALSSSAQQLLEPLIYRRPAAPSRRFSSRLLITTMPIEMTASELPKRSRN